MRKNLLCLLVCAVALMTGCKKEVYEVAGKDIPAQVKLISTSESSAYTTTRVYTQYSDNISIGILDNKIAGIGKTGTTEKKDDCVIRDAGLISDFDNTFMEEAAKESGWVESLNISQGTAYVIKSNSLKGIYVAVIVKEVLTSSAPGTNSKGEEIDIITRTVTLQYRVFGENGWL